MNAVLPPETPPISNGLSDADLEASIRLVGWGIEALRDPEARPSYDFSENRIESLTVTAERSEGRVTVTTGATMSIEFRDSRRGPSMDLNFDWSTIPCERDDHARHEKAEARLAAVRAMLTSITTQDPCRVKEAETALDLALRALSARAGAAGMPDGTVIITAPCGDRGASCSVGSGNVWVETHPVMPAAAWVRNSLKPLLSVFTKQAGDVLGVRIRRASGTMPVATSPLTIMQDILLLPEELRS
jgi:hypothetical protein